MIPEVKPVAKKEGYSREGLFGTVTHYDAKGHKIGESRPGFFGGYTNYDAKGHKIGESRPGFLGGYTNYDAKGHKTGSTSPGFLGSRTHYDARGKKIGTSSSGFFGDQTHTGSFGGDAGLVNNAGAAAGIQRNERLLFGAAVAIAAIEAEDSSHAVRDAKGSPPSVQNETAKSGQTSTASETKSVKTVRYIVARSVRTEAEQIYRINGTAGVGDFAIDAETSDKVEVLAVVECLEEARPPEVRTAKTALIV